MLEKISKFLDKHDIIPEELLLWFVYIYIFGMCFAGLAYWAIDCLIA